MNRSSLPVIGEKESSSRTTLDLERLSGDFQKVVEGEVRFDRLSRALYSTDASIYQIVPLGVVLPRTEDDIRHTLRICGSLGLPITPRGGGTSQAGQSIGPGVQIDFTKYFHQVLEVNAQEKWARVRPGCVLDQLNREVGKFGLHFAPDISTSNRATIGGMIANNSSGTRSVLYGKTGAHIAELRVLLADGSEIVTRPLAGKELEEKFAQSDREGECYRLVRRLAAVHANEIERRYPKILRRVGGYNLDAFVESSLSPSKLWNLSELFVGSEGTLGLTLEAKVRLIDLPRARALLVIQFRDLLEALAATPKILEHHPSAVEVLDRFILDSTRLNAEASQLRTFLQGDPDAILLVEFFGDSIEEACGRLHQLRKDLVSGGIGYGLHDATNIAEQNRIWKLRKAALGLSMAEKGDAKAISFVEDTAVRPEHLRDYIAEFLQIVARHGTRAGVYAHASVGCLHVRPVIDLKTEAGIKQFESIAAEVADLVLKYGGSLSGEHGDGLVRSPFQEKMYGSVLYGAFREIKRTLDPLNILNPGKIVDAPPLAANLRYGAAYRTPDVPTVFDFSADGGLARAAELCAGVGECRKRREGTMCPSYQATGEEKHSTRGRANALRLAITGQLGEQGLLEPSLREALDLCLECKACKTECPTNVDMARLKAEFFHQYFKKNGLPWRNWIFGNVGTWGRWGTRTAAFSNWFLRQPLSRWLLEKLLHVDRRRCPPAFAPDTLGDLYQQNGKSDGDLLLFPDTFTYFHEPEIGLAVMNVFAGVGRPLLLASRRGEKRKESGPCTEALWCCGRPFISNGMLDRAREHARHNVGQLFRWAESGKRILACEPSCLLTLKDDYPALLRGNFRSMAEKVAAACRTPEEELDAHLSESGLKFPLRSGQGKILVHGHCHERALVGLQPTLRLLRPTTEEQVIDLEAGCCGMAGAFGYEKEHYEISRLVGENRLFPALRELGTEARIVASGFSCRRQIEHFTGRKAFHPFQVLESFLGEPFVLAVRKN